MSDQDAATASTRPPAAVFLDAGAVADGQAEPRGFDLAAVMARIETFSRPAVRVAHADWGRMHGLGAAALAHGFDQVQTAGDGAATLPIAIAAVEAVLLDPTIEVVVLVTSGAGLAPLIRCLRRHGRQVVGMAPADRVDRLFRDSCDLFIACESLGDATWTAGGDGQIVRRPTPLRPVRPGPTRPDAGPRLAPPSPEPRLDGAGEAPLLLRDTVDRHPALRVLPPDDEALDGPRPAPRPLTAGPPSEPRRGGWFRKR